MCQFTCCDPSLKLSREVVLIKGGNLRVLWKNYKNYLGIIIKYAHYPEQWFLWYVVNCQDWPTCMNVQAYLGFWCLPLISWHVSNVFQRLVTVNTKKIWTVKSLLLHGKKKEKMYVGSNSAKLPVQNWLKYFIKGVVGCWVNFQCRGVLLIWITVGQGPTALAVGAGGGCLDVFTPVYHFSFLSPSLWETARYRLKYCLKGPLSPKQLTNQLYQLLWRGNLFLDCPND